MAGVSKCYRAGRPPIQWMWRRIVLSMFINEPFSMNMFINEPLSMNMCLSLFYPFKIHGRVDVHISASLCMTHAFLLLHQCTTVQMMFNFCCTVNLLLLITSSGTGTGLFGGTLFGGSPSSLSLLLLLSDKLMIVNVDGKLESSVPCRLCLYYKTMYITGKESWF